MKWTGFAALGCAAALAVACNSNARSDRDDDVNRTSAAEIRGDDTVGTSGQAAGAAAHGQDGDARYFAEHATIAGNAEVELGKLASQRAQSADVKQFAQMMVRDHTKAGSELKQAITAHDVNPPAGLDAKHQELMDRLKQLNGAAFDREYMKAMVDGHMEVKNMLEDRAVNTEARTPGGANPTGTAGTKPAPADKSSLDAAVNQWASKTLPTVEQHLQKAQQIQSKLDNRGAGTTSSPKSTTKQETTSPKPKY
jgi:putative membrane protein